MICSPIGHNTRQAAVIELFTALEELTQHYQMLAESERACRYERDADYITGQVARYLDQARARLARTVASPGRN
jgi:hypothetical protein